MRPDFEDHAITAQAVADDIGDAFSVRHCQMVGYSFEGLIALMVNALFRAVSDLVLLEPALLKN